MTGDMIPGNNSLHLPCFTELVKPGSEMMVKTVKKMPPCKHMWF